MVATEPRAAEDHGNPAAQLQPGEIVESRFRRLNPLADEYRGRGNRAVRTIEVRRWQELVGEGEGVVTPVTVHHQRGAVAPADGPEERHALQVVSRVTRRMQPQLPETLGHVGRRPRMAARTGLTALHRIIGQVPDVSLDPGLPGRIVRYFGPREDFPRERLMLLDIAPTLAMYWQTSEDFARAYWHWFFLIQPPPLLEALIASDPVRYVRSVMGSRHAGLAPFDPAALAEYERCAALPGTATSICEDYRASAGIDLEHDRADVVAGHRLMQPLRVFWGEYGTVGRCFDVLSLWRERAHQVTGQALPCGHYIAEELPERVIAEAVPFFTP